MASNYPAGLDTFDTIDADDRMSDQVGGRRHRDMHNGVNDAVEAVQAELGTDPSGSAATVAARLDGIEAGTRLGADSVGSAQIAANAVGASELADNAVDTNAIADSAVTEPKIAVGTVPSILLGLVRNNPVLDAGTAFAGYDDMWDTIFGEPLADCGAPSAGTPTNTFDGGAP